ncbi:hypothetical protein PO909_012556 [Leuciscus waleckii]
MVMALLGMLTACSNKAHVWSRAKHHTLAETPEAASVYDVITHCFERCSSRTQLHIGHKCTMVLWPIAEVERSIQEGKRTKTKN